MNSIDQYAISYPLLNHPLGKELIETKIKYVCLLEHYRDKFCHDDKPTADRLCRFSSDFLNDRETPLIDVETSAKAILKTRFTPFRLFSFRYVFLFDCIYLLAPSDKTLAQKICDELKSSVHQRYHKRIDELFDMMFSENAKLHEKYLISSEQFNAWCKTRHYLHTEKKSIVFTATMSAGKSTLINALIGQELSYTKKAACTATIMQFHSTPIYHPHYNVLSQEEIVVNISAEAVRDYTKDREFPCAIVGYFETAFNEYQVAIYDTPGVNSSQNPIHKTLTRTELTEHPHDVIIYVIPVESYGSEDDYYHLKFINQRVPYKKIIFAVNMMDTCDFEDDSVTEIIDNVTAHLKDIGYDDPLVFPISAKAGLLFKQALAGNDLNENDRKALLAFYSKYEEPEYDLSASYQNSADPSFHSIGYKLSEVSYNDLYHAYLHTGLPQFEAVLLEAIKEV